MEAAELLEADGIEAEILDLRTIVPLDEAAVLATVQKTSKVLLLHEAPGFGGFGGSGGGGFSGGGASGSW